MANRTAPGDSHATKRLHGVVYIMAHRAVIVCSSGCVRMANVRFGGGREGCFKGGSCFSSCIHTVGVAEYIRPSRMFSMQPHDDDSPRWRHGEFVCTAPPHSSMSRLYRVGEKGSTCSTTGASMISSSLCVSVSWRGGGDGGDE